MPYTNQALQQDPATIAPPAAIPNPMPGSTGGNPGGMTFKQWVQARKGKTPVPVARGTATPGVDATINGGTVAASASGSSGNNTGSTINPNLVPPQDPGNAPPGSLPPVPVGGSPYTLQVGPHAIPIPSDVWGSIPATAQAAIQQAGAQGPGAVMKLLRGQYGNQPWVGGVLNAGMAYGKSIGKNFGGGLHMNPNRAPSNFLANEQAHWPQGAQPAPWQGGPAQQPTGGVWNPQPYLSNPAYGTPQWQFPAMGEQQPPQVQYQPAQVQGGQPIASWGPQVMANQSGANAQTYQQMLQQPYTGNLPPVPQGGPTPGKTVVSVAQTDPPMFNYSDGTSDHGTYQLRQAPQQQQYPQLGALYQGAPSAQSILLALQALQGGGQ